MNNIINPKFYEGETVMVFDEKGDYVKAFLTKKLNFQFWGVKVIGGLDLSRQQSQIFHSSLPRFLAGNDRSN